jgi:hypothetical protein
MVPNKRLQPTLNRCQVGKSIWHIRSGSRRVDSLAANARAVGPHNVNRETILGYNV